MEVNIAGQASDAPAQSNAASAAVRVTVVNNSQICSSVLRAALASLFVAFAIQLVLRGIPPGTLQELGKAFDIALLAVSIGLFILGLFLEQALRRCPVCRARITTKTEEKRCCLQCETQLWDYTDE
jgi:hypothetical protein